MICAVADVCIHTRKWTHRPTNSLSSLAEMQMLPGAWNTGVCRAFALTTHMEGTGITSSSPVGSRVLLAAFVRLCTFFSWHVGGLKIMSDIYCIGSKKSWYNPMDMMTRCALVAILRLHPKSLVLLAPVCSGFSFMSSSQAMRFFYAPLGNEQYPWVKSGNVMSCRVTLLCWLCCALGHVFILEQPSSARFGFMPRWRYFCDNIAYVFRQQKFCTCVNQSQERK